MKRNKKKSKRNNKRSQLLHGVPEKKKFILDASADTGEQAASVNPYKIMQQKNTPDRVEKNIENFDTVGGSENNYEAGTLEALLYTEPVESEYAEMDERRVVHINKDGTLAEKRGPKVKFSKEQLKSTIMLSKLGASDKQLASYFEVTEGTVKRWIAKYRIFREARQKGGLDADMQVVEAFFKRATGYDYEEEELKYINNQWQTVKIRKHVPPDAKLIIKWLEKRQKEQWGNSKQIEHTGTINHAHRGIEEIDMASLSKKAQKALYLINQQQLTDGERDN